MTQQLTKDNINDEINSEKPIIIDFYGDWCAPCKQFAPTFENISKEFKEIDFAKFDIDQDEKVTAIKLEIRSVPTIITFKKGKEIDRFTGSLSEDDFRDKIKEIIK